MINIEAGGQVFKLRNNWDEVTLGEFETIQNILEGDIRTENWKLVINLLSGWPISQMDLWNSKDFNKLTNMILPVDDIKLSNSIKSVIIDDRIFVYQPSNMTARLARDVEKAYRSEKYLSMIVATLFNETKRDNLAWESIVDKAECLRKGTMDNFISVLWLTNSQALFAANDKIKNELKEAIRN